MMLITLMSTAVSIILIFVGVVRGVCVPGGSSGSQAPDLGEGSGGGVQDGLPSGVIVAEMTSGVFL